MDTKLIDNMTVQELTRLQNHYLSCLLSGSMSETTYNDYEQKIIAAMNKKQSVNLPAYWRVN